MRTHIPTQAGKVSLDRLQNIARTSWQSASEVPIGEPVLYSYMQDTLKYDFLWSPKSNSNKLFVLFSGDAMRAKNDPPVFQRWSWASFFPGHCLFFSDPILYLNKKIGLAWYSGTEKTDVLKVIAEIIIAFSKSLGIKERNIYAYGSSGGGFAALRLLQFIPSSASIAINPQTEICRYEYKSVERYLNECFSGRSRAEALRDFPSRMSLIESVEHLRGKRIALVQNSMDSHHFEEHYKPLCEALEVGSEHNPDARPVLRVLFEHEGGHRKAETPAVFSAIMERVEKGLF